MWVLMNWSRGFRWLAVVVSAALVWSVSPAAATAGPPLSLGLGQAAVSGWAGVQSAGSTSVDAVMGVFARPPATPAKATASADEKKPPTRVRELVGKRTATTKVYELSSGERQAEISSEPVHYRDGDGKWRDIDTAIRPTEKTGFAFGNTANRFATYFGTSSEHLVQFEFGSRRATVGLPGEGRELTPVVDGDTVTYEDVFGAADLRYRVTAEGVKEEIVLQKKPEAETDFSFTIDIAGVRAAQQEDGSIGFFRPGKDLRPVFEIPKPFMFDSADQPTWSDALTQSVNQQGKRLTVTLAIDQTWLNDDEREYPVTVDPTIIVEPTPTQGQDAMIRSSASSTNYGESWQLGVGTDGSGKARSLVRFDTSFIEPGTAVSAYVHMWYDQAYHTNENDVRLDMHQADAAWDESTVTWSNASGSRRRRLWSRR